MERIMIFGGHGKVARLLTPLLVARGKTVTSVIRNPEHAPQIVRLGATPVVDDIEQLDTQSLADLIQGHDAVVWSAGAGGGNPTRTYAVDRDAAIRSIDAAVLASVQRYIMVSYFNAAADHGIAPDHSFFPYAESKAAADAHLRSSSLNWTILGPSALTLEPGTGKIDVRAEASGHVSRANVAEVIASALEEDATIRKTVRFNDGEEPIAQALRSAR